MLQDVPGPMLAHLCMEPGFVLGGCLAVALRSSVNLLVGGADPRHGWLQGPGNSKACAGPLVSRAGSQGSWLRGPMRLRAGVASGG